MLGHLCHCACSALLAKASPCVLLQAHPHLLHGVPQDIQAEGERGLEGAPGCLEDRVGALVAGLEAAAEAAA